MENLTKFSFWIAAVALVTAFGSCTVVENSDDSIMNLVNLDRVNKLIAQRQSERAAVALSSVHMHVNEPVDDISNPVIMNEPNQEESMSLPQNILHNVLRSSSEALYITRREYLKKDWCRGKVLTHRIKEPGCEERTVINKFCYGQCNSYYIPDEPHPRHQLPGANPDQPFSSCTQCKPKRVSKRSVRLNCPGQTPPYKTVVFERVKRCKCLPIS